ncbi:isopropylmalate/homocitrate/citramalate synthase [Rivularia sp. PCC 7116]|nr:isopropylmalate/homocitrate/citramalate synthase [Rivularia sp. PCC 7116]
MVQASTKIDIIDCSLRDGEQSPGIWFDFDEKLALARALSEAGVAVLDAGFPASSSEEIEIIQAIAHEDLVATLGATARPIHRDIVSADKAHAEEVFLFMPTSNLRLNTTLGWSRETASDNLTQAACQAAELGMQIGIVFEDATRADPTYMIELVNRLQQVLPEWIEHIIIADSVGCSKPQSMQALFQQLHQACGSEVTWVPHCHNDFGLASANTLAAVQGGAQAVTTTVNGIGERAGNADLAEVVAGLTHLLNKSHNINPQALMDLSLLVALISGIPVHPLKPVVGHNAFRHESGLHVDAMLKNHHSYEFLPADWVGRKREYVIGKHSGSSALVQHFLEQKGESLGREIAEAVLQRIKHKRMSDSKAEHQAWFKTYQTTIQYLLAGVDEEFVANQYQRLCDEKNLK